MSPEKLAELRALAAKSTHVLFTAEDDQRFAYVIGHGDPQTITDLCEEVEALRARAKVLEDALCGLLDDPGGCPFCDSGILRKRVDGAFPLHADECPYLIAQAALAAAPPAGAVSMSVEPAIDPRGALAKPIAAMPAAPASRGPRYANKHVDEVEALIHSGAQDRADRRRVPDNYVLDIIEDLREERATSAALREQIATAVDVMCRLCDGIAELPESEHLVPIAGSFLVDAAAAAVSYWAEVRREALEPLRDAVKVIRTWHGEVSWDTYYNKAPEMKPIREALASPPVPENK